ncbi:MAG: TauD/TfdA family dioxygenase [Actinomycetota bacterium]
MKVSPTGGPLGAYITDIDLATVGPDQAAAIRAAWLEHLVLVFPDQPLSSLDYLAFAEMLGTPAEYPFVEGLDGNPFIIEVLKLPHETVNFGGIWHADTVYLDRPPMASMLLAREIPPIGGDTEFANQYLAWDTLDAELRQLLDGRVAMNSSAAAMSIRNTADRMTDEQAAQVFESRHPAVRTHPETGRKSLYVNVAHTYGLVDVDPDVSVPALERVFKHQTRPQFIWRLSWQPNMIALWDNRCCLHHPINDYDGHTRRMHRITLEGDVPA